MPGFKIDSPFVPTGDQPQAIKELMEGLRRGDRHQVLLGVTGSGKTFTVANVVEQIDRPTLVMAHNKTLAAQLYQEFKLLFPDNAVAYFVSYSDYYQPEAYVASTDTYIEKDSTINDAIDRMRHTATRALFERDDVLIVASVSCIYGLGSAEAYYDMLAFVEKGRELGRDALLRKLVELQYERNDISFHRGTFRVRGDVVEVFPVHEEDRAVRVEFFGDEVEAIREIDPLRGKVVRDLPKYAIFPSSHYVTAPEHRQRAIEAIREELRERLQVLKADNHLVEAQRLEQRTMFDLEMMEQMGYCTGIENYSRHLTGRAPGEPPPTLIDYFPKDFLLVVDESHQTLPQVAGMYRGDRARKRNLVDYGFRLPSALDNRPLRFDEFLGHVGRAIHVSATPADQELEWTGGVVVEQLIRPTGLLDPAVEIQPAADQVDHLLAEIRTTVARGERVLVTTLTKRLAEELTDYYQELGVRVRYLHSEIDTLERIAILTELRKGGFDVLVGINLLREGLDLPEVSLVAILDADKEGFLRSDRSLIQTMGRAARHVEGRVILYADTITGSMQRAVEETQRRRAKQAAYNQANGITPRSISKAIHELEGPADYSQLDYHDYAMAAEPGGELDQEALVALPGRIDALKRKMLEAAAELEFERAAELRDEVRALEQLELRLR